MESIQTVQETGQEFEPRQLPQPTKPSKPIDIESTHGKRRPAIVLDGGVAALSVVRCLGARGIPVYAINQPGSYVCRSRYCQWIELPDGAPPTTWSTFLLGAPSDHLRGAVLLAASDLGIQFIAKHRQQLAERFLLDESEPHAQLDMLNKQATYEHARAAGVPTPRFWPIKTLDDVLALRDELVYPLILKPLLSHVFRQRFGTKFVVVNNFDELMDRYEPIRTTGIEMKLVEQIPGPDDRLCSYYTYLDENQRPLFDFTKRIIRRFPESMGLGCYHITDWNPEVREVAMKLFRQAKLRGLANAEFKYDERDGRLKLMECNARFTDANCLVAAAGYDLPWFVYNRLVYRRHIEFGDYRRGMRLWNPLLDFEAACALRRQGRLSWPAWLRSIAHRQVFPYFRWDDPMPTLAAESRRAIGFVSRRVTRLVRRLRT